MARICCIRLLGFQFDLRYDLLGGIFLIGIRIPSQKQIHLFQNDLKLIPDISYSTQRVECMAVSGDLSGSPFYHWRWKAKDLADGVIWPKSTWQIQQIFRSAVQNRVPLTIRGAGTCYVGSSVPAVGGFVIDTKQMTRYEIDIKHEWIRCQPGLSFGKIIETLKSMNYELGCYPASAPSATVGGWFGVGGKIGIGTCKNGSFTDQIVQIEWVTPAGNVEKITDPLQIKQYSETYGTLGMVTGICIKIHPLSIYTQRIVGFHEISDSITAIKTLIEQPQTHSILFLTPPNYIWPEIHSDLSYFLLISSEISSIGKNLVSFRNAQEFIAPLPESIWHDRCSLEICIKKEAPAWMIQQYQIYFEKLEPFLLQIKRLETKYHLNLHAQGWIRKDGLIRLLVVALTDNLHWIHFLASKAALHKLNTFGYHQSTKDSSESSKFQPYAIGMLNVFLFEHYERRNAKLFRQRKRQQDPSGIFNPLKVIGSRISFRRIEIMFRLILQWRRLEIILGLHKTHDPQFGREKK